MKSKEAIPFRSASYFFGIANTICEKGVFILPTHTYRIPDLEPHFLLSRPFSYFGDPFLISEPISRLRDPFLALVPNSVK